MPSFPQVRSSASGIDPVAASSVAAPAVAAPAVGVAPLPSAVAAAPPWGRGRTGPRPPIPAQSRPEPRRHLGVLIGCRIRTFTSPSAAWQTCAAATALATTSSLRRASRSTSRQRMPPSRCTMASSLWTAPSSPRRTSSPAPACALPRHRRPNAPAPTRSTSTSRTAPPSSPSRTPASPIYVAPAAAGSPSRAASRLRGGARMCSCSRTSRAQTSLCGAGPLSCAAEPRYERLASPGGTRLIATVPQVRYRKSCVRPPLRPEPQA